MTEQEEIWDRLKYGLYGGSTTIVCHGNGVAKRFNSGWLTGASIVRVTVDDVAKSIHRDYIIVLNDIVFKEAPGNGHTIKIEVRD